MKCAVIYLAGKVPKNDDELRDYDDWRARFEKAVKERVSSSETEIVCLDPSHVHFDISDTYGIFGRDVYMVKSSDYVVIDAREKMGPGTAQEMLIAKYFAKPVIAILPKDSHYWKDTKIRDKGAKSWMNPFIAATSDAIAGTVEEAAEKIAGCIVNGSGICAKNIRLLDSAVKYYTSTVLEKDGSMGALHKKLNGRSRLVLASKSAGREKILRESGFDFEVMPGSVDESKIADNNPEELVKKLALVKAEDVASKVDKSKIVIGVDTLCAFKGKIIGKPKDREDAIKMLESFSGKTHSVFSGIAVVSKESKKSLLDVSKAAVTFRKLSGTEIEDYLKSDDAYRFAGAYNIEGTMSMRFIESINGSYGCVIGMPLEKLIPMLRECGFDA